MEEQEQNIDVGRYVGVLLHWWWVVVLAVAVFAGGAFVWSTLTKETVYTARSTFLIQESRSGLGPGIGDLQTSQDLARTYRQLLTTRPLMQRVIEEANLPQGVDQLSNKVRVSVRSGTPLVDVEVKASDPDSPVAIANTLTQVFIQDRQTTRLTEIARLEAAANAVGTTNTESLVAAQLSTLGSMSIVEPATISEASITPSTRKNMLLAGILGLLVGVVTAFFIDYSSIRIKSVDQIDKLVTASNLPPSIMGVVFQWPVKEVGEGTLVVHSQPDSVYSEMFRQVRTGFKFATAANPGKAFMVSSVGPKEGKSTIMCNLGAALAQGGSNVIMVDTDLRRPTVHRFVNLDRRSGGLSSLMLDSMDAASQLRDTEIPNLRVLLCGPLPPNPADLLGTARMDQILDELKSECDILLLDSPPIMAASDPSILASKVDGVVLVVNIGQTRSDTFSDALRQIQRSGTPILGYVVNKVKTKGLGYGRYRYRYHYYYYQRDEDADTADASTNGARQHPLEGGRTRYEATKASPRYKAPVDPSSNVRQVARA